MNTYSHASTHLSRRTLMKGCLATAGGVVMNWGGLTSTALGEAASKNNKHCIFLFMNGGASQFETFDLKPGRPTGGPYRPINTNVPGVQICELMPKLARQMDKLAVIRSMRTSEIGHNEGIYLMHTAYRNIGATQYPEFGSIVAKYHGVAGADLPNFVKISSVGNAGPGILGPRYQSFRIGSEGDAPPYIESTLTAEKELRRHELRAFVEDRFTSQTNSDLSKAHRESYEAARRLQNARNAFKLGEEWSKYKELYGDSEFGKRCLLARQLVEKGVAFVEVGQSSYDTHADNFTGHEGLVPPMQHAWAGLLEDLHQRGLLDDTVVVWAGEIGRTPSINNRAGRDHYVRSWSTALCGGRIKGGQVYGASDENGLDVKENLVTEGDFFATIYQAMGINPAEENYAGLRPIPLAPSGSKVVNALLT